ncbi:probable serine/threonine-protein kinase pats1 [Saccostrea cucullata]|uniref:probable serine/threonine-protein kinase pats1 n=1 Tax=Saccostrea cuccullata TaxID=36930 RepID=UPI002ECFCCD5
MIGKDAVKIYRSRLMIVGCAGAGKTTLLERLLNRDLVEFPETKSTVALDTHESIFKISEETNKMIAISGNYPDKNEKTLSVTDFAGQSAYYACHQVYLSRRALYILVIDLSKEPTELVSPEKTFSREALFDNWTYRDYYKFWMESISTYCDKTSPVILVGTHKDLVSEQTEKCKTKFERFDNFLSQLPDVNQLQKHLHRKNYFELGKPGESRDEMERLEKCIVEMIQKQSTWGEILPKQWDDFDRKLGSFKTERLITYLKLIHSNKFKTLIPEQNEDILDMLRFYHDCGKILFFNEIGLSDFIILDVQWFVNAFKNVITDKNHRTRVTMKEWTSFNETGMLEDDHIITIWTELGLHEMILYKDQVLLYMQRLGLIAVGNENLYVPSVNKLELADNDFEQIENSKHTSILKFKFPQFLPHFYFYRLVVASMGHWKAQEDGKLPLLFKNAAFLKYTDNCHRIVLGVSSSQIHLQIYNCNSKPLEANAILDIRCKIESFLEQLTQTFHKPVEYFPGFTCKSTNVTEESEDAVFIRESEAVEIYLADPSESSSLCPKHDRNLHYLSWKQMLMYWRKENDQEHKKSQRLFSRRSDLVKRRNRYVKWKKDAEDVETWEYSD